MASSYGTDAGITALEASYRRLAPLLNPARLSTRHKTRLDGEAIAHLKALRLWQRARVVLIHPSETNGVDMARVAQEAFAAKKRVGLSVVAVMADVLDTCGSAAPSVDFVEIFSADEVDQASDGQVPAVQEGRRCSEGDTSGFACKDLLESVCLVPGLVFDGEGHRIAEDDGAWDRFLAYYPGHKVALVHALQVSSNPLPVESGGVKVDYVVSDGCAWKCRPQTAS